jgi:hypothetical protein
MRRWRDLDPTLTTPSALCNVSRSFLFSGRICVKLAFEFMINASRNFLLRRQLRYCGSFQRDVMCCMVANRDVSFDILHKNDSSILNSRQSWKALHFTLGKLLQFSEFGILFLPKVGKVPPDFQHTCICGDHPRPQSLWRIAEICTMIWKIYYDGLDSGSMVILSTQMKMLGGRSCLPSYHLLWSKPQARHTTRHTVSLLHKGRQKSGLPFNFWGLPQR